MGQTSFCSFPSLAHSFRGVTADAMLRQACVRLSMRRAAVRFAEERGVKPGPGVAGMSGETLTAPETVSGTVASVKEVFTPPTKQDVVEAIGYPGQKQATA